MHDQNHDFSTPTVRIVDALHPNGFVLVNRSDFEDRRRQRAKALSGGEDVYDLPEMILYSDPKPASPKGNTP